MNCFTSFEIEAFALGSLCIGEITEAHFQNCPSCGAALEAYRNYYKIAETTDIIYPENLNSRIFSQPSRMFTLTPMKRLASTQKPRLAAKTKWYQNHTFVRGFINEKEDMVARVMRDESSGEFILFLIAPPEKLKRSYLIRIDEIEKTWLSDESGVVSLGKHHVSEIVDAVIHLSSARATFEMAPLKLNDKKEVATGTFVINNAASEKIIITIDASQEKRIYEIKIDHLADLESESKVYVSIFQDKLRDVRPAVNGIAVFENLDETSTLKIKIY